MTKEEALAFKARWQLVNEFINEEIRQTPFETKLKQLSAVFYRAPKSDSLRKEAEDVRARWQKLREKFNV